MDETSASRYRAAEARLWRELGSEPRERWVDVAGHDISVRVLEVGEGPPILFVHGATVAGSMWATLVARLARHRCLILDRPGCGLSQPLPADQAGSFPALVDVQVAVLDALDVETCDVVGHSFGGGGVLWLAMMKSQRVRRIVLEGAPTIAGIRPNLFIRLLAAGSVSRYLARRRMSVRDLRWAFGQWGERKLLASGWPHGATLEWALSMDRDTDTERNEVRVVQAIASWHAFRSERLFDPARLSGIIQPTLWLWGADDPIATVDHGRAWAASMPDAVFVVLDAGHLPWLSAPEFHAARIGAFLDGSERFPGVGVGVELPVAVTV